MLTPELQKIAEDHARWREMAKQDVEKRTEFLRGLSGFLSRVIVRHKISG